MRSVDRKSSVNAIRFTHRVWINPSASPVSSLPIISQNEINKCYAETNRSTEKCSFSQIDKCDSINVSTYIIRIHYHSHLLYFVNFSLFVSFRNRYDFRSFDYIRQAALQVHAIVHLYIYLLYFSYLFE